MFLFLFRKNSYFFPFSFFGRLEVELLLFLHTKIRYITKKAQGVQRRAKQNTATYPEYIQKRQSTNA